MSFCTASTKKGKPCKNPATYPEICSVYCWVHKPKSAKATPGPEPGGPSGHELESKPKPKKILKLKPKSKTVSITPKVHITDKIIHEILQRKQDVYSIINDLYKLGLRLYEGDRDLAIKYIKDNFTYDLYKINILKLHEGLDILKNYLGTLTKQSPDYLLFTEQINQLNKVITILDALYKNGGNPNAFENTLISYELKIQEMNQQIEQVPTIQQHAVKIPSTPDPVKTKKISIALRK